MSEEEDVAIVVDHGTANVRVGWAGDEGPKSVIPSLVGKLREGKEAPVENKTTYIGKAAQEHRALLDLEFPMDGGVVDDWDAMDRIYDLMFSRLDTQPRGKRVLFSERPMNDKRNREELAELMFETYELGSMYVASSAILSLYASNRDTGVIVDVGSGVTTVVPVYCGFTPPKAPQRREVAGRALTLAMQEHLLDQGVPLDVASAQTFVQKFCFVAMDEEDRTSSKPKSFDLPSGQSITLDKVRYEVPELLFQDKDTSVHGAVWSAIAKCNRDMRRDLFSNIVLTGGTTKLSNFSERLERELRNNTKCPSGAKLAFDINPGRELQTWFGGSILAELGDFQNNWVSREEFEERGSQVIHRIQKR